MIQSYLFPISYAFMAFPFAALLFTLPFLVVQYRRHGYINKVRAFVLYLFLLYLMNAIFLVMLPLPASRHNSPLIGSGMQLIPFHFIQDIMKETSMVKGDPATYWLLLKERAFLQVLFNVLLTIPFGMLIRYYFRLGPLRSLFLSFLLSLLFEVTQLTGIYGIYDHAYRVFDVDDLMTNTLGGMIGFLAAEWLSGLLPRIEHLDRGVDLSAKRVSYTRRALAFMFDIVICGALISICYRLQVPGVGAYYIVTGVYFMLLPYLTKGCTFGKWLVRIRLTDDRPDDQAESDGVSQTGQGTGSVLRLKRSTRPAKPTRIKLISLVLRYGILYWLFIGANYMLIFSTGNWSGVTRILLGMLMVVFDLWFLSHLVTHLLRKEPTLFYEKLSKTKHQIMWTSSVETTSSPN